MRMILLIVGVALAGCSGPKSPAAVGGDLAQPINPGADPVAGGATLPGSECNLAGQASCDPAATL